MSSVQLAAVDCDPPADASTFPFAVPSVATLRRIDFDAPVTLLVGENGSGKSSLPDARSYGEVFLSLFGRRLVPRGLYLLDEPEAPLSPQSRLAFLAMTRDAVREGSQLVIATHSPILMATPGARILGFDDPPVRPVAFDEIEAVALVRDFLQAPDRYLRLIRDEDDGS